jgi:hypothetical protein
MKPSVESDIPLLTGELIGTIGVPEQGNGARLQTPR